MAGERTIRIKVDGQDDSQKAMSSAGRNLSTLDRAGRRAAGGIGATATATGRASTALDKHGKAAAKTASLNDRLTNSFSAGGVAALGFGVAVGAWVRMTGESLMRIERLNAQTTTVIKSMNAAWTDTDAITAYAEKIEKMSGVEAESVQEGQNLLLTYGNIVNRVGKGNNIFDQATSLMTDLSVATGKDMPGAATLLGKALNAPIQGLTALQKVGVSFTEQQKAQIKALVESGDVMGAQKIILAELTKEFGGSAAAFGETTAGQVAKLQNEFGNLSEELLANLLPAINGVVRFLSDAAHWLDENQGLVTTLAVALGGLVATYLAVRGAIMLVNGSTAAFNAISGLMRGNVAGLGAGFMGLSTAARVASLSMGAIGIILTLAGTAMAIFGDTSSDASAQQQQLADAGKRVGEEIQKQNGVITENIRMMTAKEAADAGLFKLGREIGVSQKEVVDALLNEGDARAMVASKTRANRDAIDGLGKGILGLVGVQENEYSAGAKLQEGIDKFIGSTEEQTQATKDTTAANEGTTASLQAQTEALMALIDAQKEQAGIVLDAREATRNWQVALESANESIAKNGKNIDDNTEAGRDNNENLDALGKSSLDLVSNLAALGASQDVLTSKMATARASFIGTAIQMGYTEAQANLLADQLGLIPGTYTATVVAQTSTATNDVSALQTYLNNLISKPYHVKVTTDLPAGGGGLIGSPVPPRATGGPMQAGRSYLVGERGPEILKMPNSSGGTMIPNHALSTSNNVDVTVLLDGTVLDAKIHTKITENDRRIKRAAAGRPGRSR